MLRDMAGSVWCDLVRRGLVWSGKAGMACSGKERLVQAGQGQEWHGLVWQAWLGLVRWGKVRFGLAWLGMVWQARFGTVGYVPLR